MVWFDSRSSLTRSKNFATSEQLNVSVDTVGYVSISITYMLCLCWLLVLECLKNLGCLSCFKGYGFSVKGCYVKSLLVEKGDSITKLHDTRILFIG